MKQKAFGIIAASTLFLLVSPPVQAVTVHGTFDGTVRNRASAQNVYDLDHELANILAREDENSNKCLTKCSNRNGSDGGHSGGGGIGLGGGLGSGQSLAGLFGGGSSGGSGGHSNGGPNLGDDFSSAANLQQFDPGERNVAAAPLPAALPLFASGLAGLGLLGWLRKRKASWST